MSAGGSKSEGPVRTLSVAGSKFLCLAGAIARPLPPPPATTLPERIGLAATTSVTAARSFSVCAVVQPGDQVKFTCKNRGRNEWCSIDDLKFYSGGL